VINEKKPINPENIKLFNLILKNFQILDFFNKSEKNSLEEPYITVDATLGVNENSYL
jgi:hypothetical protein